METFRVICTECRTGYDQTGKRPEICGACGSEAITTTTLDLGGDSSEDNATTPEARAAIALAKETA